MQRARDIGLSIEACRILLSLYENKDLNSEEVKRIAKAQIQNIKLKISELEELRHSLVHLMQHCTDVERPGFPIINRFAGGDLDDQTQPRKVH